jgi:hypothetical protein
MRKYSLEGIAGPFLSNLSSARRFAEIHWRRVLAEAGLLLGMALASSWLVNR